jgi:mono/diheme cytochrome c family protein
MPPMGLDDQQAADVLSYVRSNFGHNSPPISAADVAAVRKASAERSGYWTASELSR